MGRGQTRIRRIETDLFLKIIRANPPNLCSSASQLLCLIETQGRLHRRRLSAQRQ